LFYVKAYILREGICSSAQNWQKSTLKQDVCCLERVVNSARLGIIANKFYFEIGCFVYYLNVFQAEFFQ